MILPWGQQYLKRLWKAPSKKFPRETNDWFMSSEKCWKADLVSMFQRVPTGDEMVNLSTFQRVSKLSNSLNVRQSSKIPFLVCKCEFCRLHLTPHCHATQYCQHSLQWLQSFILLCYAVDQLFLFWGVCVFNGWFHSF